MLRMSVLVLVNVFLPPMEYARLDFLQAVFEDTKSVLMKNQVHQFTVPTQPELAVNLVFCNLNEDLELMTYFDTDKALKGKFPERNFFWGILAAVRKELYSALLDEVNQKRMAAAQQ